MANRRGISIPQCVEPDLRNCLTAIVQQLNTLAPVFNIVNTRDGDVNIEINNITNEEGDVFSSTVIAAIFREAVLDGNLQRGLTANAFLIDPEDDSTTAEAVEVHGWYVPAGKRLLSGARVAIVWNGFVWRVISTDTCVVTDPSPP